MDCRREGLGFLSIRRSHLQRGTTVVLPPVFGLKVGERLFP